MVRRVSVRVEIDAPVERVWRALCDPVEVQAWDGAKPLDVPAGYPQPGQHARWRVRIAGVPIVLHDRVRAVRQPDLLAARITYAFVDIEEEYRLEAHGGNTTVTSDNDVRSRPSGLGGLAAAFTRRSVEGTLERLAQHCAR